MLQMLNTQSAVYPSILSWNEVEVGELIGSGAFASVFSLGSTPNKLVRRSETHDTEDESSSSASLSNDEEKDVDEATICSQSLSADSSSSKLQKSHTSAKSSKGYKSSYVIKSLHQNSQSPNERQSALRSLSTEASILAELPDQHPNIIRLVAVSTDFYRPHSKKGFLVFERLEDTLDTVLKRWRKQEKKAAPPAAEHFKRTNSVAKLGVRVGILNSLFRPSSSDSSAQMARLQHVILDVGRAMVFLHEHHVLHRDIKPGNVGFDKQGRVKLFDFGCSRRLDPDPTTVRRLTRLVGTTRYMAPEVAYSPMYSFSADVHSFSIVAWEVLTLKRPFLGLASTKEELKHLIQIEGKRPVLRGVVHSSKLRKLFTDGWNPEPRSRPTIAQMVRALEDECHSSKPQKRASFQL